MPAKREIQRAHRPISSVVDLSIVILKVADEPQLSSLACRLNNFGPNLRRTLIIWEAFGMAEPDHGRFNPVESQVRFFPDCLQSGEGVC